MRNTGVTDVYDLSIPVEIDFVAGVTTHRYVNGDGFSIVVKNNGGDKVWMAIYMPDNGDLIDDKAEVPVENVRDEVMNMFGRYRF